jgi:hypothetical protein
MIPTPRYRLYRNYCRKPVRHIRPGVFIGRLVDSSPESGVIRQAKCMPNDTVRPRSPVVSYRTCIAADVVSDLHFAGVFLMGVIFKV